MKSFRKFQYYFQLGVQIVQPSIHFDLQGVGGLRQAIRPTSRLHPNATLRQFLIDEHCVVDLLLDQRRQVTVTQILGAAVH